MSEPGQVEAEQLECGAVSRYGCKCMLHEGHEGDHDPKCGWRHGFPQETQPAEVCQPVDAEPSKSRKERQAQVSKWCIAAFGADEAVNIAQRGLRLLEEAAEAAQSVDVDIAQAHKLLDYVWSRPKGEPVQELGGVGVTVLALAAAIGESAEEAEVREVRRVLSKPLHHFRERNKAKNDAGFLAPKPSSLEVRS